MRVLVTGGAGFLGSHLSIRLARHGYSVTVIDNPSRGRRSSIAPVADRVIFYEADIRDRDALHKSMHGVAVVFHLAAQSNVLGAVSDPEYSFSTNVAGTLNVLQEARTCGVQRVVFTSSREVYGESTSLPVQEDSILRPKNAYGASKAAAEMYCNALQSKELEIVILRLANVYGPGDSGRVIPLFFEQAARGVPLTIYGENKLLDFVWVGDVVEALWRAGMMDVAGAVINVGSGKATTLNELANVILAITGSHALILQAPARDPEIDRYVADIRRAGKALGFSPCSDPLYRLRDVWTAMQTGESFQ